MPVEKHIPTPNFGLGRGDRIDQIIEESDRQLKTLPAKIDADTSPLKSDTALQLNPSFKEMLEEVENFDAAMSSGDGVPPTKYDQAFISALRTMLRECLFTKNPLMRKSHVDKIYTWFQQKRKPTLNGAAKQDVKLPSKSDGKPPLPPPKIDREAKRALQLSKLKFPEAEDQRSIKRAESSNGEQETSFSVPTARRDVDSFENEQFSDTLLRPACDRVKEYKMRNLRISQMRRQGIPMAAIRAAANAVQMQAEKKAQDALGLSSTKITEVEQAIRELWIRKRQEEEQDRISEKEVKDAMLWWARNRARTEEEISRRQESIRFSSQTALLHSRPNPAAASAARSAGGRIGSITSATDEGDEDLVATDEDDEDIEIIEDLMYEKYVLPDKFLKTPHLTAPYDGLRSSTTSAGWALASPARPISARLAGRAPGASHNFGSPRPMSASAASNARTFRSQSARARAPADAAAPGGGAAAASISTYPWGGGVPREGAPRPFELHGFASPHAASASRPPSSYRGSRAGSPRQTSPRGGGGDAGPEVAARVLQLAEVDRIKRSFARSRVVCALNVIERALTVPNDRCYAKCVDLLPRAGAHLLRNPVAKKEKPPAKGKGKKGKKKGDKGAKKG